MKRSSLAELWTLLAPYKNKVLWLSLLIAFSASLSQISPQFTRIVIDELIPRGEVRLFVWMTLAIVVFYLFSALMDYFAMLSSYAFTQRVINDLRLRAYERLLALPLQRFTKERSGSLVSRVMADVDALESMIQAGATRIVGTLFGVVVAFIILLSMNWILALLSLFIIAAMGFFTLYYRGQLRAISKDIRAKIAEMTAIVTEAVGNIAVVKTFANERLEFMRFQKENEAYYQRGLDRRKVSGVMQGFVGLSSNLGMAALLLLGAWFVVSQRQVAALGLTTGELMAFLLYLRNLIMPIMFIVDFNNILQSGMAALERVNNLLEDTPETGGTVTMLQDTNIVLRDVYFTYPEAERPSLNGLSLHIKAGETVALVGSSGGGKSTITKLLSRLYDPQAGEVIVGGIHLRQYKLETLRNSIAHVPQDPTLFSGSVTENIRYARPEATDAEVTEAARLANANGFIEGLPQGYDTEIGERGVKLSGGQKQRIAIARAILKRAKILVLDEATSSLDSESEYVIQDALDKLFWNQHDSQNQDVTSIVIAHRLSTIQNADKIFVIDQGQVAETGTHRELLARGGIYKTLYDLQFREELELGETSKLLKHQSY
ncbi:MAG: ABC transporter ATP-binding protein [Trueperaceae bacterium]